MKERISLENITDNKEVVETLKKDIAMFLCYDPKEEKNPFGSYFNHALLLFGEPGSGKTRLIEASVNYAKDLAEKAGKPLKINEMDLEKTYKDNFSSEIRQQSEERAVCHLNALQGIDMPLSIYQQGNRNIESIKILSEFKAAIAKNYDNVLTIICSTHTDEKQIEPSVRRRCLCLKIEPDYSLK